MPGSRIRIKEGLRDKVDQSQLSSDSDPVKTRAQEQGGAEGDQTKPASVQKRGPRKIPAAFGTAGTSKYFIHLVHDSISTQAQHWGKSQRSQ